MYLVGFALSFIFGKNLFGTKKQAGLLRAHASPAILQLAMLSLPPARGRAASRRLGIACVCELSYLFYFYFYFYFYYYYFILFYFRLLFYFGPFSLLWQRYPLKASIPCVSVKRYAF